MQIYYILDEIDQKYPNNVYLKTYMEKKLTGDDEDYFIRPNNPKELLQVEHIVPFLMQYLKDMKNEYIEILMNSESAKFLKTMECSFDDLSDLSDEQLMTFKESFKQNRMSKFHRNQSKQMTLLYDTVIDILSKRVPVEHVHVKVE